jgi:hypothetical protein
MTLFASVAGVFGDILGILILGIAAVALFFVVQLLRPGQKSSRPLDEQPPRDATNDKRNAA